MEWILGALIVGMLIGIIFSYGAALEVNKRWAKFEKVTNAEIKGLQEQLEFYRRQENNYKNF